MSSYVEKFPAEKVFFWSDLHFYHQNILKYQPNRQWADVEEMNEAIVENWNRKVPTGSTTFVLGDVALGGKNRGDDVANLLRRVNSHIFLVPGNHDNYIFDHKGCMSQMRVLPPLKEISLIDGKDRQHVVLCHFPILSWHRYAQGAWHLFGHTHGNLKSNPGLSMDVGIDTNPNQEPYSYYEIKKIMSAKQIQFVDHHTKDTNY